MQTFEGLDPETIRAAARRIAPHIRRTPVLRVDGADFGFPKLRLVFKLEYLQHAASGGNHGAAVAYAAMKTRHPATIFVPEVASPAKMAQIRGYGARLEIVGE